MIDLDQLQKSLARKRQDYHHARRTVNEERQALKSAKSALHESTEAQRILQGCAVTAQEAAHTKIASVVTRCLFAVFGREAYAFQIRFDRKRGKTEAVLVFTRNGEELDDPLHQCGLGTVDVAAFALRLACLVLSRPRKRRLLILDEPFKWVSAKYRETVAEMLRALSDDLGVTFLLVTHMEELQGDHCIRLEKAPESRLPKARQKVRLRASEI